MSEREADLLDDYLDACLEGTAPKPEVLLRRHPDLSSAAQARMASMYAMATSAGSVSTGAARANAESTNGSTNGSTDGSTNGSTDGETRTVGVAAASAPDDAPERVGEFRLLEPLGSGGMGRVYLAEQESLGRHVAVKLLHPELLRSKTAVERFRREARALAKLKHANVVEVYAVGEQDGQPYIAMELVHGRTLSDLLSEGAERGRAPSVTQVVTWLCDISRALHSAHIGGIVHRDVKPANIRIGDDGQPRLLDFGIARDDAFDGSLTHTFAGSPLYAAPEQITGADLDARADVYGLGVTLYECLAGRVPFAGGPFDQIVKRVLDEEPLSPRLLNPAVSRDLGVICCKALEKEPGARYATAAAMADDLTAVLENRPIQARAPSRVARLRKWSRRNPARATAAVSAGAAAVLLTAFLVLQGVAAERQRRDDARALVTTAQERLAAYRKARERTHELDQEIGRLQNELTYRYLPPREMRTLDVAEDDVRVARREREAMFYGVLDALRQAEQLDAGVSGAQEVRTDLFFEKWREAQAARDGVSASFYRERIEQAGGSPSLREGDVLKQRIRVTTEPPGASVHLFRCSELNKLLPQGEHRLVALPDGVESSGFADAWALRVAGDTAALPVGTEIIAVRGHPVRAAWFIADDAAPLQRYDYLVSIDATDAADLEPEDLVVSAEDKRRFAFLRDGETVAFAGSVLHGAAAELWTAERIAERGDVDATVWNDGSGETVQLPSGLDLVTTAVPLLRSASSLIGTSPIDIERSSGQYLLLIEMEGYVPMRYGLGAATLPVHVQLTRKEDALPGCVFVPAYPERPDAFWMMQHEVTCAEYAVFLNDPETRREINQAPRLIRVPRGPENLTTGGEWPKDESGRYVLPEDWQLDWPVIGVSWEDAQAFAAWKTRRARAAGRPLTWTLPTYREWMAAGSGSTVRSYVFGHRFRPKWMASCFGRRVPLPRAVCSLPIDESLHGVFDMSGNAVEWIADWFDETRRLRHVVSGSWARSDPTLFKIEGGHGYTQTFANGETGFRLIARRGRP